MATATATPKTPKTTTSVDPLYTQAIEQAKAALQPQIDTIAGQQTASDALERQREIDAVGTDGTGGAYGALAGLLKPIAGQVQGIYTNAEQNQELAANGFSHGMQDALNGNADNLNALLEKFHSPATIDSKATQAGDVLYGLGGYMPGETFGREGAAFAAAAANLPANALAQGADTVKQLQIKQTTEDAGFQSKIAEIAAKLPGDAQTNYTKLQSLALQDKKFREQVVHDKATEALARAKYKTSVDEFNSKQTLAYKKLAVSESQFAQRQANSDRNYQLAVSRLGISEKRLQLSIAGNAFKAAHGGFTAVQVGRFNTKLDALVASAGVLTRPVNGVMPTPQYQDKNGKWKDITPNSSIPKSAKTRNNATYANFITAALRKGVPIQLAIQRANTLFPETQRALPPALQSLPAIAAQAAQQARDYSQMTGQTLGTSPNGTAITWSAPKNLSSAGKKAVSGILSLASEYLGTPYAWGGESPTGFDCSGLAQYIYAKEGISIPRTTYDQFQRGLVVPRGQLQAGDLVFFQGSDGRNGLPGHVGIYVGNGKMIQAPHTGDVVKISSLSGFPGYMGARRYVH